MTTEEILAIILASATLLSITAITGVVIERHRNNREAKIGYRRTPNQSDGDS